MGASTWVPLVTAAAGLAAGLATGLIGTVLARRWVREDRAAAWQREDALRWHQDRLQAYTRMIAALDAWEAEGARRTPALSAGRVPAAAGDARLRTGGRRGDTVSARVRLRRWALATRSSGSRRPSPGLWRKAARTSTRARSGSGWAIVDNKGRPVREYELFFSGTHRFEFAQKEGVSTV